MRSVITHLQFPEYFNPNGTPKDLKLQHIYKITISRGMFAVPTVFLAKEIPIIDTSKIQYLDIGGNRQTVNIKKADRVKVKRKSILKRVTPSHGLRHE